MAESEQRFVLRARSRNVARFIGYPVGGCLVLVAVVGLIRGPDGGGGGLFLLAMFGIFFLLWAWATNRCRVEVTEQGVTVVHGAGFRRDVVPWRALADIEVEKYENNFGLYCLTFVVKDDAAETQPRWFLSEVPMRRSRYDMMELRARILRAGGFPLAGSRTRPERCPTGQHPLKTAAGQRGWLFCDCVEDAAGHRFWHCRPAA